MTTLTTCSLILNAVAEQLSEQSPWLWSLGIVLLLGVGWLLRQQQLAWQLRLDREQVLLRNRIAADLHDEVGSLLMRIHMQVESASQAVPAPAAGNNLVSPSGLNLQHLLLNTRAVSAALRDVVWCMDSHDTTLSAVIDRMHDQLVQVEAISCVSTALETSGLSGREELPSKLRQQVYMIFKEAITNTLRHAQGATQLQVRIVCQANTLSLEVIDNGNAKLLGRSGLGLRNMQKRAASVKGQLEIGPRSDEQGFRVHLRTPFVCST
jgi:signal transduction histidine kinase